MTGIHPSERDQFDIARRPRYRPTKRGVLGVTALVAMTLGFLQNILFTYTHVNFVNNLDDIIIVVMFILSIARWGRIPQVALIILTIWIIFISVALLRSLDEGYTSVSEGFFLFRQVVIPAVVVLIGVVLTRLEWLMIAKFTVKLGTVTAIYCFYEEVVGRPVDPAVMSRADGLYIYPSGLPGNYMGFWLDGSLMVRAGGPYLNPPTAGILLAVASVISFHSYTGKKRFLLLALLVPAMFLTVSRAGMLVLVIGIVLPWAARKITGYLVLPILIAASIPFARTLLEQGGTGSHLNGLVVGLNHGITNVFGRGFGFVGNYTSLDSTERAGESLAGIAFSAGGMPIIFVYSLTIFVLVRKIVIAPENWVPSLALSALIAALFAETAGSMNATVPLWLAVGYALNPDSISTKNRRHSLNQKSTTIPLQTFQSN